MTTGIDWFCAKKGRVDCACTDLQQFRKSGSTTQNRSISIRSLSRTISSVTLVITPRSISAVARDTQTLAGSRYDTLMTAYAWRTGLAAPADNTTAINLRDEDSDDVEEAFHLTNAPSRGAPGFA
jgi:hypothetical protein